MSGIVGIYNTNERPVETEQIQRMLDLIGYRGPDGCHLWTKGVVGLGQAMLHTTPESLHEVLPLTIGDVTITADVRIDNRDDLFERLKIERDLQASMPDSELLLRAYLLWGVDCLQYLLGDFAFAIWDEAQHRLFCARDHFGLKPLCYYYAENQFLFGSDIKVILANLASEPPVNEDMIIDRILGDFSNKMSTIYQGVYQLPPATFLLIDGQGRLSSDIYWKLDPERDIYLPSDDDYVEQFRELFTQAIQARLRSAFPVGTALSGGLDSSSIACISRNLLGANLPGGNPLSVFCAITPDVASSDERFYQDAVISTGGFTPHFVRIDGLSPLYDSDRMFDCFDQPINAANQYIDWPIFQSARDAGVRVFFNGLDGDSVVSHGLARIREFTIRGDWKSIQREADQFALHSNASESAGRAVLYHSHVLPALRYLVKHRQFETVIKSFGQMHTYFGYSYGKVAKKVAEVFLPMTSERLDYLLRYRTPLYNPEAAISSDSIRRYKAKPKLWKELAESEIVTERAYQYNRLTSGVFASLLQGEEAAAAYFGIEPRSPYCDVRLVEFCLAIPADQKLADGWPRLLLRRAMKDILPEEVQSRMSKAHFRDNFKVGLINRDREKIEAIRNQIEYLVPTINMKTFTPILQEYLDRGEIKYDAIIWYVLCTSLWLDYKKKSKIMS